MTHTPISDIWTVCRRVARKLRNHMAAEGMSDFLNLARVLVKPRERRAGSHDRLEVVTSHLGVAKPESIRVRATGTATINPGQFSGIWTVFRRAARRIRNRIAPAPTMGPHVPLRFGDLLLSAIGKVGLAVAVVIIWGMR